MSDERRWVYENVASGGDANGETCIFCKQPIRNESQAGHWVCKADEDYQDADFVTANGYAHWDCTQKRLTASRASRFQIPEPPDIPGRP